MLFFLEPLWIQILEEPHYTDFERHPLALYLHIYEHFHLVLLTHILIYNMEHPWGEKKSNE